MSARSGYDAIIGHQLSLSGGRFFYEAEYAMMERDVLENGS